MKPPPTYHVLKPDIDNLAKFVLDCMNQKFYPDDSQVVLLHCSKVYGNDVGTHVTIETVS
jgi:Holliday junction resolvase RusA-like endonuclease